MEILIIKKNSDKANPQHLKLSPNVLKLSSTHSQSHYYYIFYIKFEYNLYNKIIMIQSSINQRHTPYHSPIMMLILLLLLTSLTKSYNINHNWVLLASKGFGTSNKSSIKSSNKSSKGPSRGPSKSKKTKIVVPSPTPTVSPSSPTPPTLSSSVSLSLSHISSNPTLYTPPTPSDIDLYNLLPPLLQSRYLPSTLGRIPSFLHSYILLSHVTSSSERHSILKKDFPDPKHPLRPPSDIHAYMPRVGGDGPFLNPSDYPFVSDVLSNFESIKSEYTSVVKYLEKGGEGAGFKSLTSMNYQSGWSTLCTHTNGRPSPTFPFHLTPVLSSILSKVPVAGRICGFNRQLPGSGIKAHTDGNNMWLTLQVPLVCGEGMATIDNGGEERVYEVGKGERGGL